MATSLLTIKQNARYIALGDSSDAEFSDTDVLREINKGYADLVEFVISRSGRWEYGLTYATVNLEAGVNKYDLPSDFLRISKVDVKPIASLDNYLPATQIDLQSIPTSQDQYTPSSPEFDLRLNKIVIYYSQDIEDVTNGLKIWFQQELDDLVDDTDEVDLPNFAVDYIVLYAAKKYCLSTEMFNKGRELERQMVALREQILEFYSNRGEVKEILMSPEDLNFR